MLAAESNQVVKRQSARERARKASREIMKERNDTSGGGVVSEYSVSYRFSSQLRYKHNRVKLCYVCITYKMH